MADQRRTRIRFTGIVQGVGFRPFVWSRATALGLSGWVENDPGGVTVEVQGPALAIDAFLAAFEDAAPPLASLDGVDATDMPCHLDEPTGFAILASNAIPGHRSAVVPPDVAPCTACLAEMNDPRDRRHGYPFITCTDCGPRFTIIESLPYDRTTTTMRSFALCPACDAEYHDPGSRRFHAETIACPSCGPMPWYVATETTAMPSGQAADHGVSALSAARASLRSGAIVAIKGVGGFHLACDATNPVAVERLRRRKQRPRKPLAVMVANVAAARAIANVSEQERRLLEGRERPIVLVARGSEPEGIATSVAPGNDFLGVMLPSSPLHHLLVQDMPPLVMTSGNLAEEPIAIDNTEAISRLGSIADGFLLHDRGIHVACDDSVVRCIAGLPQPIRRSRGYAPLPIRLATDGPTVLAVGGELKGAICVAHGREAVMGQHLGDMGNLETLEALDRSATHLLTALDVAPDLIAADLHPGYLSARWARDYAAARGIPLVQVQHHEAHVAALLAEHGRDLTASEGFVGVCFDGTGYGRDGTIHGGEFFVVENARPVRRAHLLAFPLPGGDAAIRHPWRTALAMLWMAGVAWHDSIPSVAAAPPRERVLLEKQLAGGLGCIDCTSMGRLFDAVASIVGVRHSIDYEAEAALNLEAIACPAIAPPSGRYAFPVTTHDDRLIADWRPLVGAIAADATLGVPVGVMASAFQEAVVQMIVATCHHLRGEDSRSAVGLTGGVFQNAVLSSRAAAALQACGIDPLLHHAVPANDGGLSLGQAVMARRQISC